MNSKELYQSGIQLFQQGQFNQGYKLLLESAKLNYIPALKEIGLCYFYGIAVKANLSKAIKYFKIAQSDPEAQFELSKLYFFGFGLEKDLKRAKIHLIASVKQKYTPAMNLMAVCYKMAGKNKKANTLFSYSYAQNDKFAAHLYSQNFIKLNQNKMKFIKKFNWPKLDNIYNKNTLHKEPTIFTILDILCDIECEYIKYISSPFMRESMTIDPQTGQTIRDEIRTSYSATLDWTTEDPAINLIMQKCCQQFKVDGSQSEVLHVLHYSIGEEYKPHYDFFGGIEGKQNFDESTQRNKTICLYLNDVTSGGQTSFPKLNMQVKPQKGMAVFFENVNEKTNTPYIESLHAGKPVIQGEKWLATLWIRNNDTQRGPNYDSIPS